MEAEFYEHAGEGVCGRCEERKRNTWWIPNWRGQRRGCIECLWEVWADAAETENGSDGTGATADSAGGRE